MPGASVGDATTTVGAEPKSAWLTEIDIRAGVAPPTTTVPRTPGGADAGGLDAGGDTGGGDAGAELDAGTDAARLDDGGLNACGLLTPGNALDACAVGD